MSGLTEPLISYHFLIQFLYRFGDQVLRAADQAGDEGVGLAALIEQGQRPVQVEERIRRVVFQHVRVQERRAETQVDVGDGIAMVVVGHADVHRRNVQVAGMLLILLDVMAVLVYIAKVVCGLTVARVVHPVSAKKRTNERASFVWDCKGLDKFMIRKIPLQEVNWRGDVFYSLCSIHSSYDEGINTSDLSITFPE